MFTGEFSVPEKESDGTEMPPGIKSKKVLYILSELEDQYLSGDESVPWVVGFSGGKDSTALLQLVWLAVADLPESYRRREIFVVCNDTLVENPVIQSYVVDVLERMKVAAKEQGLPIHVDTTVPQADQTFWVNVIGRGYPVPNNTFRWCTDRLKISPTGRFIEERVAESGEAIILVGTRRGESATRARSIARHEIRSRRLVRHPTQAHAFVYSPIKEMTLEEVWYVINVIPSPWGADNGTLFQIYADASADDYECPTMVADKSHTSCGQSRFGCWTCTVVPEDKSLKTLIARGKNWLAPLLKLRNEMYDERNQSENRMSTRRNGQRAVTSEGRNFGPYTPDYRAGLLKRLLAAQVEIQKEKPHAELISTRDLITIQLLWQHDSAMSHGWKFSKTVSQICNEVYGRKVEMDKSEEHRKQEAELLRKCCGNETQAKLLEDLLALVDSKRLLASKRGLDDDIESALDDFLRSTHERSSQPQRTEGNR